MRNVHASAQGQAGAVAHVGATPSLPGAVSAANISNTWRSWPSLKVSRWSKIEARKAPKRASSDVWRRASSSSACSEKCG